MHFYQMLRYVNKDDAHQTAVPALDVIGNVNLSGDSPEGLYQDVIDAVRKVARAKQRRALFKMDSEGFEELLPSNGQAWKTVVVTEADDGGILFYELTDHVPKVQPTCPANQVAGNADESNADSGGVKEQAV